MKSASKPPELRMIPVDRIDVLNTRDRDPDRFDEVDQSVAALGLKKPVTVTPRPGDDGAERYLLACGEGRLLIFQRHGETRIPALIVHVSDEDAFIMSLVENIARRRHSPVELMRGITLLRDQGFKNREIAQKTNLDESYVRQVLELLDKGEERLLTAVGHGKVPISVAILIASMGEDDGALQLAMQQAYELGQMKGPQLRFAAGLAERRKALGPSRSQRPSKKPPAVTTSALMREYRREAERQRRLVRKSNLVQQRLLVIFGALRRMFDDENLANLLQLEHLDTLPKYLADRLTASKEH